MLKGAQIEVLTDKVYKLLADIGIMVESEALAEIILAKGGTAGADHRLRIPRELIEEMVAFQKKTQALYDRDMELLPLFGPDWTHHIIWHKQQDQMRARYQKEFIMQAFDCGPTLYYDYPTGQPQAVDNEIFDRMMKFAGATPEIGYISTWYRQDVAPMLERIDSLVRGLRLTRKVDGVEAIYPEVIKYLKEASEIITGQVGDSSYLAGSECMTMPLILDRRSAEDILARKAAGVHRYHVASMPTMGISTPVTLAGSMVMGAAEILGGMVACWCADPESDLSGRMITLLADMHNAQSTPTGPETCLYNMGVKQLFDVCWGGHCMVEVFFSPVAQKPGLQAVFENFFGTYNRARWEGRPDFPYAGMGTLKSGGLGSPTQLMLDMEIRKAQWFDRAVKVDEETIDFAEICERIKGRSDFLSSEHTMRHFRKLWMSRLFLSDDPYGGAWDGTEKAILDKCEEMWRANLARWQPPVWPEEMLKALDALVLRAKKEFSSN
jgi:trimethylamine:corrinoid methyltransferase-like protein